MDDKAKREIFNIPRLSKEEEIKLGKQIKEGDENGEKAQERLIMAYLPLALWAAIRKSNKTGIPEDDLFIAAHEGLSKGTAKFDYTRSSSYYYLKNWISAYINQEIRSFLSQRGLSRHILTFYRKINYYLDRGYSREETATKLNVSLKYIENTLLYVGKDVYLANPWDENNGISVVETLRSPPSSLEVKDRLTKQSYYLKRLIKKCLTARERYVLNYRYGLLNNIEKTYTLKEMGRLLGVSKEAVRLIEKKAINKIKESELIENRLLRELVELIAEHYQE